MKFNTFLKFMWFELKKIFNSPLVFIFVIFVPLILSVFFGIYSNSRTSSIENLTDNGSTIPSDIVFVANGEVDDRFNVMINQTLNKEMTIVWENNLEEAILDLKLNNISLIIFVETTTTPNSINIIYDISNSISTQYKDKLILEGYKFSYYSIKEALSEYGIRIEDYAFNSHTIDESENSFIKGTETNAIAIILAFILAVGISFCMARDNETGVIKQLAYTPMSSNKYLFVRWCFFSAIAIIQSLIMILVFWIFGAPNGTNFMGMWGISCLFGMAFSSIGLLFSTSKNQLSSISLAVVSIIAPIILIVMGITNINPLLKGIIYISPITPFILTFKTCLYYGVVNFFNIIMLVLHAILYYLVAGIILKNKSSKKNKN